MDKVKEELTKTIEALNKEDMINERKKRLAFAKVNELLIANPDIKMDNVQIDNMIEEVVADVNK